MVENKDLNAPEVIYLAQDDNNEIGERYWCEDKINDNDIKYIRHDLHHKKAPTGEAKTRLEAFAENYINNTDIDDLECGVGFEIIPQKVIDSLNNTKAPQPTGEIGDIFTLSLKIAESVFDKISEYKGARPFLSMNRYIAADDVRNILEEALKATPKPTGEIGELIERIDVELKRFNKNYHVHQVLDDCKAQLQQSHKTRSALEDLFDACKSDIVGEGSALVWTKDSAMGQAEQILNNEN